MVLFLVYSDVAIGAALARFADWKFDMVCLSLDRDYLAWLSGLRLKFSTIVECTAAPNSHRGCERPQLQLFIAS